MTSTEREELRAWSDSTQNRRVASLVRMLLAENAELRRAETKKQAIERAEQKPKRG